MSETWLTTMFNSNMITVPGYIIYRHDRQTLREDRPNITKKGGGLAVYVKDDIHVDATSMENMNLSNQDIEIQCLVIRPPSQKRFVLVNIYRPPSGNFQQFSDTLVECLDHITSVEDLETFVMGDFNTDISDPQNPNAPSLVENLLHLGLSQKIDSHNSSFQKQSLLNNRSYLH